MTADSLIAACRSIEDKDVQFVLCVGTPGEGDGRFVTNVPRLAVITALRAAIVVLGGIEEPHPPGEKS